MNNALTIIDYESLYVQKNHEYAIYVPEGSMRNLVHLFVRSTHDSIYGQGTGRDFAKRLSLLNEKRKVIESETPNGEQDSDDKMVH